MMLSIGGRMFRVRAFKAEADNANTLRLRHLHSLFDDNNHATSLLTSNSTADFSDHYYPPAADGDGGPSITSNTYTMSSAPTNHTQSNNNIDELSDNRSYLSQSLPLDIICLIIGIVFIVLFCSKRHRHSVGNEEESSTPSANQAAEQRKLEELEERKKRIGEVLVSRLIVEDEEENVVKKVVYFENKGGRKDEGISANNAAAAGGFHDRSEDDEENQIVNDEDQGQGEENYEDEEMGMKEAVAEDKTLAQDEDAAAGALVTIPSNEETTVATVPSSSSEETTIAAMPSNSNEVVPTIGVSSSSSSTFMVAVSPSPSPPSSPYRKHAVALSCNNYHTQNSDATNTNIISGNKSPFDSPSSLPTITLSTIQQTYGEECNICLSNFQVGDRAAWSKHHFNGCTHVFHDECMKRWLLVRDGCPICRRSYLNGVVEKKSQ